MEYFQRAYFVSEGASDAKAMDDAAAEIKKLIPSERMMPSMNDNDSFDMLRTPAALTALPPNAARVGVTRVGRRGAPHNPRSSRHRASQARTAAAHS